jgi:putative flippase GtrA
VPSLHHLPVRFGTSWRLLIKELSAFGVVGGMSFLVQVSCFQLLYAHWGVGAVTSNLVATVISMTVAYVGHRYWSFSHRARSGVGREYLLFAVINVVTLLLGLVIVALVRYPLAQEGALPLQLANIGSIAVGTVIRYLSYRRWVFRAPREAAAGTRPTQGIPRTSDVGRRGTEGPQIEPLRG